jgi:hypothetical protein
MPDGLKYYQKIHANLVNAYGKEAVPDEQTFYNKLSNSEYRNGVYTNLANFYGKNAVPSFNEFESKLEVPKPSKAAEIAVPSVQKYQKAVDKDRDSWGNVLKTTYNNLLGSAERLIGGIIEIVPTISYLPPQLWKYEKMAAKEDVGKAFEKIKAEIPKEAEAEIQAGFNIRDGIGLKDLKALTAMAGGVIGDIALAAPTYGATYFIQGFGDGVKEYDEAIKRTGTKGNDASRALFGAVNGTINGLLETYALNKVFGKGPALSSIKKKVVSEVFDEAVKSGKKISVDALEKAAETKIRKLASTVRAKGVKALYGSAVEGATEGIQTGLQDAARLVTNKIENKEVFDSEDIKRNIGWNIANSMAAGAALGLPMGGVSALSTNIDTQVLKDVAAAKTEQDFVKIRTDLEDTFNKNNFSEDEKSAIITKMQEYAKIKQTLPSTLPAEVQEKAISKIQERQSIDSDISQKQSMVESMDESIKNDVNMEIQMMRDKRSLINDEIRESASDDKFKYFEQEGKYFKQFGENEPEEISKNYFELADVKERQQKDKPLPTDKNLIPTILVDGREYTGANHGEAMQKAIEAGEDVPSPETEMGQKWREENGLFRDVNGKLHERDEAEKEFGVRRSEQLIKTEPVAAEEKGLKMSTIKQYTKAEQDAIIDEIGTPISARQAAMSALVNGWRFGKKNFSTETGIRIPEKSWFLTEKGPNIESSAESIWENLPDDIQPMFEPQDIRNELIDILQEFSSKESIREGYIKEFAPKEMTEADYINWYERNKQELDPIEKEWENWMMEQGESEIAAELDESVINDLITKYEQESTTKGEGVAERAATEVTEGVISEDAYESARKIADEGEFNDYDKWRQEQLRNEEAINKEYESSSTRDFESREDFLLRKYCAGR